MKSRLFVLALLPLLTLTLTLLGCGKSGSATIDASQVEKSFANADDAVKAAATRAVNAIKTADYNMAVAELLKLAADPNLTAQQKKTVAEALDQLKAASGEAAKDASGETGKALGDPPKTLDK